MTPEEILKNIRTIPDFPKPGIMFKDITTALKEPQVFKAIIDNLANLVAKKEFDYIAAVESRGYLLGAPLAYKLNKGLIIIRKPGKLPAPTERVDYGLEYGTDSLEIHKDAITKGKKVLIVDDLLATGGTIKAAIELIEKVGGKPAGCLFLMELTEISKNVAIPTTVYSLIRC